jgi:hypothetical protein
MEVVYGEKFRHQGSSSRTAFKASASAGKVVLTDFWDFQGMMNSEFMPTGTTVKSERYFETLG